MHETTFTDALLPSGATVLGLPLRPYSLGHEILLLRRRNPLLVSSSAEFHALEFWQQLRALREAVWLCSDTYSDQPATWFQVRWNNFCRQIWCRRIKKLTIDDYNLAHIEFRNYLADAYSTVFKTLNPGDEDDVRADDFCADDGGYEPITKLRGRTMGAPLIARLLKHVTADNQFRSHGYASPYDFPYGAALNLYLTQLESEGSARIESPAEAAAKARWADDVAWAKAEEAKQASGQSDLRPQTSDRCPQPGLATAVPEELLEKSDECQVTSDEHGSRPAPGLAHGLVHPAPPSTINSQPSTS